MTYNARQEAREVVGETELYFFDFGDNVGREYYTTSRKPISWTPSGYVDSNIIWTPLPIGRSSFKDTNKNTSRKPKLSMPCRPKFISMLKNGELDFLQVIVLRGFGTDYATNYRNIFFRGFLSDVAVSTKKVTGTLVSIEEVFDTLLPRIVYQSLCNNALHDDTCGKPFTFDYGTVVSITDDRDIRLDISSGNSDISTSVLSQHYSLGRAWKRVEDPPGTPDPNDPMNFREILYSSNNLGGDVLQIVTHAPVLGLKVGDKLNVSAGCDHHIDTCILKHMNRLNFVGMPHVPGVHPVTEGF